jgi:hypothetical protein
MLRLKEPSEPTKSDTSDTKPASTPPENLKPQDKPPTPPVKEAVAPATTQLPTWCNCVDWKQPAAKTISNIRKRLKHTGIRTEGTNLIQSKIRSISRSNSTRNTAHLMTLTKSLALILTVLVLTAPMALNLLVMPVLLYCQYFFES